MHEAHTVTFVEQLSFHSRYFCQDKCHHQLDTEINIQNRILARVR